MRTFRIALAQINATVGDLQGNAERIVRYLDEARSLGCDLVSFPELAVTGYPPEDLVLRRRFIQENEETLHRLVSATEGITAVIGYVDAREDIYNAAAVIHDGRLIDVYHKHYLPNYGVFDEDRYFQAGRRNPVYEIAGVKVGVNICEDIWYPGDPTREQALAGAEVIVNINASPFHAGKRVWRGKMLATRANDNAVIVCYTNLVGGQDELVFDGNSAVYDQEGRLLCEGPQFNEALVVCDLSVDAVMQSRLHDSRRRKERFDEHDHAHQPPIHISSVPARLDRPPIPSQPVARFSEEGEVYEALVLGTRDYMRKTGFADALIGLSGGVDSSLVAAVAVDALGADHVVGVSMPSRYSSEGSRSDAEELAENLGICLIMLPIEGPFTAFLEALAGEFDGTQFGLAEENIQSRTRAVYLMALANKFNRLVLTTGNKSEMAAGYGTLYGDMAGAYAVIKDVYKLMVYRLCEYRNARDGRPVIPEAVLTKPPSAELRPDQKDSDSLPPYEVLDPILKAYVEDDRSLEEIVAAGADPATARRVIDLVNRAEYKRRQAPPGVKVTPRAFGRDRRLPIANRYRGY